MPYASKRAYTVAEIPGVDPRQALWTAVLVLAIQDARSGDHEAYQWIIDEAPAILDAIAPLDTDPDVLMSHLLAMVPAPEEALPV